jgi:hypothetical protein
MRESKNLLGYCFTGILTMYLSIQFHECFHWAIGRILNVGIIVGLYTASHQNIPDWKSMMIDAGGAIITLIFELIGFALYRMKRETWKSFGLSLLFVVSIGRILYEFSGIVIHARTDETNFANLMGVPDWPIRTAVSVFGILLLGYLIYKKELGTSSKWKLVALALGLAIGIIWVLLLGNIFDVQRTLGRYPFQPVIFGYSPLLILLNGVMILFLAYLIWRRGNFSAIGITLFPLLIAAMLGWGVLQPVPATLCRSAPQVIGITPSNGNIERFNEYGQRAVIRFDRPMAMLNNKPNGINIVFDDALGPLDPMVSWSSPETFVVEFGRTIHPGESIELLFEKVLDANGQNICQPIHLKFE